MLFAKKTWAMEATEILGVFPHQQGRTAPTLSQSHPIDRLASTKLFCTSLRVKNTDQMMRTQNWAVLYEIVKVIHDNGNEEVEDKKATDEDETGEEEVGEVWSAACGIFFLWVWITSSCLGRE